MTPNTHRYAIAALKRKRGSLAAEIIQLESQLRHRKDSLLHVDATLRLLDPSIETKAIPIRRIVKRVRLFRHGELGRMVLGALREAGHRPLSTTEIATALLAVDGYDKTVTPAMAQRVRGQLHHMKRRGKVLKTGEGKSVRWSL